jgi:hypothetical protein
MSKTHDLITSPAPETVIKPAFTYTDEQTAQIETLRKYAYSELLPESDPYHYWQRRWIDRPDTVPRYMRAAKWKMDDAKKRIKGTLEWRKEFKPDLIKPEDIRIESETGKIILNGFDVDGRPIIYMNPSKENSTVTERQLKHLVFILERAKDMQPLGVESIVILIDYRGTTLRTNPSISIARKVLVILQNHYVETLGRGLVVYLPAILNFFYKGISPFLDPVTRDKIRFNPTLTELIPKSQLHSDFGGDYPYEFEPKAYWDQLVANAHIAPDGTRTDEGPDFDSRRRTSETLSEADSADTHVEAVTPPTKHAEITTPADAAVAPNVA